MEYNVYNLNWAQIHKKDAMWLFVHVGIEVSCTHMLMFGFNP